MIARRLQAAATAPRRTMQAIEAAQENSSALLEVDLPNLDPLADALDTFDAFGALALVLGRLPHTAQTVDGSSRPPAREPEVLRPLAHPTVPPDFIEKALAAVAPAFEYSPEPASEPARVHAVERAAPPAGRPAQGFTPRPQDPTTVPGFRPERSGVKAPTLGRSEITVEVARESLRTRLQRVAPSSTTVPVTRGGVPPAVAHWLQAVTSNPDARIEIIGNAPPKAAYEPIWRRLGAVIDRTQSRRRSHASPRTTGVEPASSRESAAQSSASTMSPTPLTADALAQPSVHSAVLAKSGSSPSREAATPVEGLRGLVAGLSKRSRQEAAPQSASAPFLPSFLHAGIDDLAAQVAAVLAREARRAGIEVEP